MRLHFSPVAWLLLVSPLLLVGCGEATDDLHGKRAGVSGTVRLDDMAVYRARIVFSPLQGEKKVEAIGQVVDGMYQIPAEAGPLVGEMRVEIHPAQLELEEFEALRGSDKQKRVPVNAVEIPAKYNAQSTLKALVTEDETQNVFHFKLQSKPK